MPMCGMPAQADRSPIRLRHGFGLPTTPIENPKAEPNMKLQRLQARECLRRCRSQWVGHLRGFLSMQGRPRGLPASGPRSRARSKTRPKASDEGSEVDDGPFSGSDFGAGVDATCREPIWPSSARCARDPWSQLQHQNPNKKMGRRANPSPARRSVARSFERPRTQDFWACSVHETAYMKQRPQTCLMHGLKYMHIPNQAAEVCASTQCMHALAYLSLGEFRAAPGGPPRMLKEVVHPKQMSPTWANLGECCRHRAKVGWARPKFGRIRDFLRYIRANFGSSHTNLARYQGK